MMTQGNSYWIFVQREQGEELYRVSLFGKSGRVRIPNLGKVDYAIAQDGKGQGVCENKDYDIVFLREGDVASKGTFQGFGPLRKSDMKRISHVSSSIVVAIALLVSTFTLFSNSDAKYPQEESSPIEISEVEAMPPVAFKSPDVVKASIPQASDTTMVFVPASFQPVGEKSVEETREVEEIPQVQKAQSRPKRHATRVRSRKNWDLYEREAKRAFQKGKVSKAKEYLEDIRVANGGHLPRNLHSLASEVDYAYCQQSIRTGKWRNAVKACEAAQARTGHPRAERALKRLAAKSRKFYLEGYVMEGMNAQAAISKYRLALASAPKGSEFGQKAAQKLKTTSPGSGY